MVWPPDSPWAPWWSTSKEIARAMCKLCLLTNKDKIYELGSGNGTSLIIAATEYSSAGVGIEIDPIRVNYSKFIIKLKKLSKKIKIIQGNFFDYDLSEATVLYVYLVPKALEKLKPKFIKELKKGTRIVSLRYRLNLPLIKEDKKNNLYLYKI